jgi:hypothetical protein
LYDCNNTIALCLYGSDRISYFNRFIQAYKQALLVFSRYLFRIPSEYFSIFLISSVAGYPVGASFYRLKVSGKIDKKTAEDMLPTVILEDLLYMWSCRNNTVFKCKAGMTVFLSVFAANVIIAVLIGLFKKFRLKAKKSLMFRFL